MPKSFARFFYLLLVLLCSAFTCCKSEEQNQSRTQEPSRNWQDRRARKADDRYNNSFDKYHAREHKKAKGQRDEYRSSKAQTGRIPQKALEVLAHIRQYNRAPEGYVGGRRFGNFEGHLPRQSLEGGRIDYREWDVNPRVNGRNRGAERLVTSSDGRAWYTRDHYNTFTEIK
ncbi:ribonuclease domain-containing protein [Rudanella lutea]|uniref:ribonuclease domain-containing protein n=1 Tax=Rudanella lutea TaxID=451374 RepID=UPI0003641D98|nr:ribonuclease domain-containing protein [Rudanella lutea]